MIKRYGAALIVFLLVASLMGAGQASSDSPATLARTRTGIDAGLSSLLAASPAQVQPFFVWMANEADLSAAYVITDWNARGGFVVDALYKTAQRSQAPLVAQLKSAGIPYTSCWINNSILVSGTLSLAQQVAGRSDVARLLPERTFLLRPIDADQPEATLAAVEWGISMVRAPQVWSTYGVRGASIVVATIDSGVRYTHEALVGKYRGNNGDGTFTHDYNWWDPQHTYPVPADDNGHGTHTMGTIVGSTAANQIGVAPEARWIAAQGCKGYECSGGDLLSSAQWVLAPTRVDGTAPDPAERPQVVSNSWGDCVSNTHDWFRSAVQAWRASGIFAVFAAGNTSGCGYTVPFCGSIGNPAGYVEALAVGATTSSDTIAPFSLWGPSDDPATAGEMKPEVSAPGQSIRSSYNASDSSYVLLSGTSMAAPHAAGIVALILSARPDLIGQAQAVEDALKSTAVTHAYATGCGNESNGNLINDAFGYGRLDAFAAVTRLMNAIATPTPTMTSAATATATATATSTPAGSAYEVRVNAGGPAHTDSSGQVWQADRPYAAGGWGYVGGLVYTSAAPIGNTSDGALYQSNRYWASDATPGYRFAVANGSYQVTLKFAETYRGAAGMRKFDVRIEGATVMQGFDIFVAAGGANRAVDRSFTVTVSDGELGVDFIRLAGHDTPQVNAIQVRALTVAPTPTPTVTAAATATAIGPAYELRVNAGGPSYTDRAGHVWQADTPYAAGLWGYAGGIVYANLAAIAGTPDAPLYQSNRYWASSASPGYRFSVPDGMYEVTLKFAETYRGAAGMRKFDVRIEGGTVLAGFDIFAAAGGRNRAVDRVFTVPVRDGELSIDFIRLPSYDTPQINAIQVLRK